MPRNAEAGYNCTCSTLLMLSVHQSAACYVVFLQLPAVLLQEYAANRAASRVCWHAQQAAVLCPSIYWLPAACRSVTHIGVRL